MYKDYKRAIVTNKVKNLDMILQKDDHVVLCKVDGILSKKQIKELCNMRLSMLLDRKKEVYRVDVLHFNSSTKEKKYYTHSTF